LLIFAQRFILRSFLNSNALPMPNLILTAKLMSFSFFSSSHESCDDLISSSA